MNVRGDFGYGNNVSTQALGAFVDVYHLYGHQYTNHLGS